MTPAPSSGVLPDVLLILGTDLAGKDHCANILIDAALAAGQQVERRRGAFSAAADSRRTSEDKTAFRLWLEWLFLATVPLHCRVLPYLTALLLRYDLHQFRRPSAGSLVVVSHTAIRLLAFALGQSCRNPEDMALPARIDRVLRDIVPCTGACSVVLDIDPSVRQERMAARQLRGTADHFDRYMGADAARSERIEDMLVRLGTTYLGARLVLNNNASPAQLLADLTACPPVPAAVAHQSALPCR